MNILLLSYIMNACYVRLRYHKMHIYIYVCIIEWKMMEVPKIYIYIYIYKMIFNNILNFKAQLIKYI